jgi:hypothetical protein
LYVSIVVTGEAGKTYFYKLAKEYKTLDEAKADSVFMTKEIIDKEAETGTWERGRIRCIKTGKEYFDIDYYRTNFKAIVFINEKGERQYIYAGGPF